MKSILLEISLKKKHSTIEYHSWGLTKKYTIYVVYQKLISSSNICNRPWAYDRLAGLGIAIRPRITHSSLWNFIRSHIFELVRKFLHLYSIETVLWNVGYWSKCDNREWSECALEIHISVLFLKQFTYTTNRYLNRDILHEYNNWFIFWFPYN